MNSADLELRFDDTHYVPVVTAALECFCANVSGCVFQRFQWGIVWAQECQTTHTDCSSNASTAHTPQCEQSRKFHVDGARPQLSVPLFDLRKE